MERFIHFLAVFCVAVFALPAAAAQAEGSVRIEPAHGKLGWVTHPYQARYVPPVNLANSSRLDSMIRAGNLYLTAQDVVALALENNIDIEIQRYGPLLAREILRRAEAGGLLRTVGLGVSPDDSVSAPGVSVRRARLHVEPVLNVGECLDQQPVDLIPSRSDILGDSFSKNLGDGREQMGVYHLILIPCHAE